jgi:hypothetical protein
MESVIHITRLLIEDFQIHGANPTFYFHSFEISVIFHNVFALIKRFPPFSCGFHLW